MCTVGTAERETRADGGRGAGGGEHWVNSQVLAEVFYEGSQEGVFSKKEKGKMPARAVQRSVVPPWCGAVDLQLLGSHQS